MLHLDGNEQAGWPTTMTSYMQPTCLHKALEKKYISKKSRFGSGNKRTRS